MFLYIVLLLLNINIMVQFTEHYREAAYTGNTLLHCIYGPLLTVSVEKSLQCFKMPRTIY